MGIICKLDDYRKKPARPGNMQELSLRELIGPVITWASEEEKARVLMEQAEEDMKTWQG